MDSVVLASRASLLVTSPESHGTVAQDFLNDLLTQDLASLGEVVVAAGALLTPQGRIAFDLLVSRAGHGFRLETDTHRLPALAKQLSMYRMRLVLAIDPSDAVVVVGFGGEKGWLVDKRFADTGAVVSRRYMPAVPSRDNDAKRLAGYASLRYHHAIPEGEAELPNGRALPLEAGLHRLGGISFAKGCFIGQEVTARIHHKGASRHRYIGVRLDKPLTPPVDITAGDKLIGQVLGVVATDEGIFGLAVIRVDALSSATQFMAGAAQLTPLV